MKIAAGLLFYGVAYNIDCFKAQTPNARFVLAPSQVAEPAERLVGLSAATDFSSQTPSLGALHTGGPTTGLRS